MEKTRKLVLFSCLLLVSFLASSSAQTCLNHSFSNRQYANCSDLPALNCFLHWTYDEAAGINPSGPTMLNTQALVAYVNSSGIPHAFTTSIDSMNPSMQQSALSFQVPSLSAEFENNEMRIFAVMRISESLLATNQVWQEGPVSNDQLMIHPTSGDNMRLPQVSRTRRRNVHGVLNTVSWGILMPFGAITARYMKVFKSADPAWFYLHVACQTSAYAVGVAGWATGIRLGSDSAGVTHNPHRNIGITLFCLATLQVFALLLRPNKDHKYRLYWNIYHHSVGYAVIILSIINIFDGFDILKPDDHWERIYIGILIFLGVVATLLEGFTWYIVLRRKNRGSETDKRSHSINGANGVNGFGARGQDV
ncbi:hypothetical protein ES332_A07G196100v1 [Gossypium tomentosum]|uniref:Cytochrome b561 domain-containing protein n=1 Tax=Gossypium tomentosum TaxID=34277 RepID=A0A5D2PXB8_GOSTO|nr:hypothetical protein ES332_A07G196100v1 [Gossypium tomentosum]